MQELLSKLRPVEESDRGKLLTVSYSKLSLKDQCDFRYNLKYNEGNYSNKGSMATDIGSILHKGLELKGRAIQNGEKPDYEAIRKIVYEGCEEVTDKGTEKLKGINDIMVEYFADWMAIDPNTGMDMNQKMQIYFNDVLPTRMEGNPWVIIGTEVRFEFVYDNKAIIHGFIDRIDGKYDEDGDLTAIRVIDYKSSKKVFRDADIKTPLQMVTYDLACLFLYGILPEYHEYDFILLNTKQTTDDGVCSKGYLTRGLRKLDRILDSITICNITQEFKPSPSPLCYWCEFASAYHSPNSDPKFEGMCPYYSLWTPENKTFKVNQKYEQED